ncbi:MAG: 2'-5' RNA ligase family protein [bacterium]|nr:2'-5' RNA ligase family protein [bacterium]
MAPRNEARETAHVAERGRNEKVGWWLLPAHPPGRALRAVIEGLAERFGAPTFPPHVTLASSGFEAVEDVLAAAREESSFELSVSGLETTDDVARTLALRFEGEERVRSLTRRILPDARLEGRAPPHLSLLYQHIDAAERAELASARAPLDAIRFDAIAGMRMFSGELLLDDVPRWSEIARVSFV